MVFLPSSGHDFECDFRISRMSPHDFAEILVEFWKRNERIVPAGIKKVGDL